MYGDGWTPLMACCVAGHLGIAQVLLRQARQDVRSLVLSANRYGLTAGHIAARRGDVYLLDLLLDAAGSAVSKVHLSSYFLSRSPPLFLARHLGSHTSCWLLSKQMAIEQTVRLQVPLELPSLSGMVRSVCQTPLSGCNVRMPLLRCAYLQAKDSNGETPIIVAVKYKHSNAVQLLTDAITGRREAPRGRYIPMPYNMGMRMPSKRRSLDRPACY